MRFRSLQEIKETICTTGLLILVIITIPSLIASVSRVAIVGWQPIMMIHLFCVSLVILLYLFRKRFSYTVRASTIVVLIFVVGAGELYNFGIIGAGGAYLAHSAIIAAVLLNARRSIALFTLCSMLMLGMYFIYQKGIISIDLDIHSYTTSRSAWGNFYFDYLLIWASTTAAFYYIIHALNHSITELETNNTDLELLVEQRTSELTSKKRELELALEAEKAAVKSNVNFIDMISHEYRTPLSIMMSSIDLLELDAKNNPDKDNEKTLSKMRTAGLRLRALLELSLNQKRIDASNIVFSPDETDFAVNVIHVAAELARSAHPEHRIIVDDSMWRDLTIRVDCQLMISAISNLLDNACKYSDPSVVKVILKDSEDTVSVAVCDNGVGIPEQDLDQIFEKYFRAKGSGNKSGAGVGLYLVKKIVQLHEGEISIDSRKGEGTTIAIEIPKQSSQRLSKPEIF